MYSFVLSSDDLTTISVAVGGFWMRVMKQRNTIRKSDVHFDDTMAEVNAMITAGIGVPGIGMDLSDFNMEEISYILAALVSLYENSNETPLKQQYVYSLFKRILFAANDVEIG